MKRKIIVTAVIVILAVLTLALAACAKAQSGEKETPAELSYDYIACEYGGVYVVHDNGLFYLVKEGKGVISRGFFAFDHVWLNYKNLPDCISVRLTPSGSVGFMRFDGTFLTPLNAERTDFIYSGYDRLSALTTDGEDDKNYAAFFVYSSDTRAGKIIDLETFKPIGDTYRGGGAIEGDAEKGYILLKKYEYDADEKFYETKNYAVNLKTGKEIFGYDLKVGNNIAGNEDFGIKDYDISIFQTVVPATETTEETEKYTLFSNKTAEIIAADVKETYSKNYLNTIFFGYTKDWIKADNRFSKIYYVDKNMKAAEFSADIYYARTVENEAANTSTAYNLVSCFYSTGMYVYKKSFVDNANSAKNKTEYFIKTLGKLETKIIDISDGGTIINALNDNDWFSVKRTVKNTGGVNNSYELIAFADNSAEPIVDYTVPFNTAEKAYQADFDYNILGSGKKTALSIISLYENRYTDYEQLTEILVIKKLGSACVERTVPQNVNLNWQYFEERDQVIVTLDETDTTHGTDREDAQAALWLPYEGEFNNEWHRSISLSYGLGIGFAVLTDYTKMSIVKIESNDSLKAVNNIAPKLAQISFLETRLNFLNVDVNTHDYRYFGSAFVFSVDEKDHYIPYPFATVEISDADSPFSYSALIYGEEGANGFFKEKILEFPDAKRIGNISKSIVYQKFNSGGSIRVGVSEKKGGGLNFEVFESPYFYHDSEVTMDKIHYYVTKNPSTRLYGLESENGKTIFQPQFTMLNLDGVFKSGRFFNYLIATKNGACGLYTLGADDAVQILGFEYSNIEISQSCILAVLKNGKSQIFDFNGNLKGEFDVVWGGDEDGFELFANADNAEMPDEADSLYEIDAIAQKFSKNGIPQSYVIITEFFYIIKTGDSFSAYGDINFEGFQNFNRIESFYFEGEKDNDQMSVSYAFLRNGKYIPITAHFDLSEALRNSLTGDFKENQDFWNLNTVVISGSGR